MAWEAKQAMFQTGAELLALKKRMEEVGQEQNDVLDWLLANMGDAELNARMMALTKEKESLKAKIAEVRQVEVSVENRPPDTGRCGRASRCAQRATPSLMRNLSGGSSKRSRSRTRRPSASTSGTRMWC